MCKTACLAILSSALALVSVAGPQVTVRARVVELEPEARVRIHWSWGGMGLGGDPVGGEWTISRPAAPQAPATTGDNLLDMGDDEEELLGHLKKPEADPDELIEHGGVYDYHWLKKGLWSAPMPFANFKAPNLTFVTVFAECCATNSFKQSVQPKKAVF